MSYVWYYLLGDTTCCFLELFDHLHSGTSLCYNVNERIEYSNIMRTLFILHSPVRVKLDDYSSQTPLCSIHYIILNCSPAIFSPLLDRKSVV